MRLQIHQLRIRHGSQIRPSDSLCPFGHDAINAAAVGKLYRIAAHILVVPVEKIDTAFGADFDAEPDPREVVRRHEIVAVLSNKTGTFWFHDVCQYGVFMDVAHEQPIVVLLGKRVRQIETCATMSRQVSVVADRLNVVVDVWVDVRLALLVIDATLHDMKQMRNYTARGEALAVVVKIESPWIR